MKKPRSHSKLGSLTAEQELRLTGWLLDEGVSYEEAAERLSQELRVKIDRRTMGSFYERHCVPLRLRRAAEAANALGKEAESLMVDWEASSKTLVKQKYFELLAARTIDPKELALFASQIASLDRSSAQQEKLKFDREKAAATLRVRRAQLRLAKRKFETDTAKLTLQHAQEIKSIATDGSLDLAAKIARVRQTLFGRAPGTKEEPA